MGDRRSTETTEQGSKERGSTDRPVELLQGTLDMLILKAASLGPEHGYGLLLRIEALSRSLLQVPQGSVYPALYRLEHQGLLTSEWGRSENRRKAKFYRLTAAGERRLHAETSHWERLSGAIGHVLAATPQEL